MKKTYQKKFKKFQKEFKKFIKENKISLVIVALVLAIGLPAVAGVSFKDAVIDRIADKWLSDNAQEEVSFGAITMDKNTFDHGIEIPGGGLDITGGSVDIDVDTSISNPDATYQFALNFQQATSSADNNVPDQDLNLLVGTQEISGDMLCNMAAADITANDLFEFEFRLGTTTSATSSGATLIADTSVATSTDDILNKEDDEGSNPNFVWSVDDGEYLSAMITFNPANATSSASFTAAGGNNGAGTVHVNCWNAD